MINDLNELVLKAQTGEQWALQQVVLKIQDRVHHLTMRILVNPDDASDATQEILILVITKLSTFKGNSAFHTWVYRVASNYLLTAKKIKARELGLNFDMFRIDLETNLEHESLQADNALLLNELRISCTMAMLLCLDMKHRLAYVLGDILEFDQTEAVAILEISKENYRKRLSRARAEVLAFTTTSCGLVENSAKCSCPRRLPAAIKLGRVNSDNICYANHDTPSYHSILQKTKNLEHSLKTLSLQQATPKFASPRDFGIFLSELIDNAI